ncbi:MAG: 50S ribosomal protein L25 [Firmicutes bacterium]|nr:50S ribosomal protein L25 [Bacillota bacterium]
MAINALQVQERALTGKGPARHLRTQGLIPGVMYGAGTNRHLAVPERALSKVLASQATLINLTIEGEDKELPVIIKEVQRDPVTQALLHVDFFQVDLNKPVSTTVPLVLVGEENRENDGGIIEHVLRELEISCLPTAIPDHIEVDVSGLKVHDTLHVKDIALPEGIKAETDPDELVVSVVSPGASPVEEGAEAAEEGKAAEAETTEE